MQSFSRAICGVLVELRAELLAEPLVKLCAELYTELLVEPLVELCIELYAKL